MNDDLTVSYGHVSFQLNPVLVKQQGIGQEEIDQLRATHIKKLWLFEKMEVDGIDLLNLARQVDDIEYEQQTLWRFPKDPIFHQWFKVPHCSCNKRFAESACGRSSLRAIHKACPVHSSLIDWSSGESETSRLAKRICSIVDLSDHRIVDILCTVSVSQFIPVEKNSTQEHIAALESALRGLLDWGREHTSPLDENSPHELLMTAERVLNNGYLRSGV